MTSWLQNHMTWESIIVPSQSKGWSQNLESFPAGIYLHKVNNINLGTKCEIYSKLTIKTPERFGFFIVNFEHISHVLAFLLVTFNMNLNDTDGVIIKKQ